VLKLLDWTRVRMVQMHLPARLINRVSAAVIRLRERRSEA
jgi:hypothetical protein